MEEETKPLFPVLLTGQTPGSSDVPSGSLFPVITSSSTNTTTGNDATNDLDWLENKSFIPTSILLAEEEKNKHAVQTHSSQGQPLESRSTGSDTEASSEEEAQGIQQTVRSMKRSQSVSDSDEESIVPLKMKKHSNKAKKKKHKKKKKKNKHKEMSKTNIPKDMKHSKVEDSIPDMSHQTAKTFIHEIPGLTPESAFRIDRKCEKALWNYESVYKGHIARYFRLTDDCLGNSDITLRQKNEKGKSAICRYYSKDTRKQLRKQGMPVMVDKRLDTRTCQYLSIQDKDEAHEKSSQTRDKHDPLGVLDSATSLYTQGLGVKKEGTGEDTAVDETFERTAYYNKKLQEDPSNVKLWMEFVSFQDKVFQDIRFSAKSMINKTLRETFQPPRACIEKKLAILGRALEANPSSLTLKLLKLETEQDISDSATLAKEWDRLLFVHASDVKLWRHYLAFQQSRLSTFSVGRMVKFYHRCFKTLVPILEKKVQVVKVSENLEEELIGVLEQYCRFLHDSGFTEKAVASYQALIEFNMYQPPSLNLVPTQDSVAVFESFWDSGVARFGEAGAKGWAGWVEGSKKLQRRSVGAVSTEEEQEEILVQDLPVWQTWLKIEHLRQRAHWLPWHPDTDKGETEEDCEDLDRLVLYDDIAPVLFRLQLSTSYSRLIHSFVDLLGLVQEQSMDDGAAQFDQLKLCALCQVPAASGIRVNLGVDIAWRPRAETVCFLGEVLRQSAGYFSGFQRSILCCQLLQLQSQKHGCLKLSDMSEKEAKEARKFGKNLLKEMQNRNDLMLWAAYIRSEWALGKEKEAMGMLQTALGMFTSTTSRDDHAGMAGLCSLYHTLAEILLKFTPLELANLTGRKCSPSVEAKNNVVNSFICLVDTAKFCVAKGEAPPAAQILRTRRKFKSMVTSLICDTVSTDIAVIQHSVHFVNCFALFELCAAGLSECLQVFTTAFQHCAVASEKASSAKVKKMLQILEKDLCQTVLFLLRNYMSVSVVPPSHFRSRLHASLSRFPDNPSMLFLLVELESATFMAGKLRRFFENATRDPASVYPVLFQVLAEMGRHIKVLAAATGQAEGFTDSGTVHRVRAVCEKGLQRKVAQHCPLLWRLYLLFEAQYGNKDRAKGILYRALQSCPWAKALYLDGARLFGEQQVPELVDLMTEKELRVQIPLEEVELLLNSEPQDGKAEEETETQE